jgi:hypothetical protein
VLPLHTCRLAQGPTLINSLTNNNNNKSGVLRQMVSGLVHDAVQSSLPWLTAEISCAFCHQLHKPLFFTPLETIGAHPPTTK